MRAVILLGTFRKHVYLGYCTDRSKCFTSEAEGHNTVKVIFYWYLTCCMTKKGYRQIIFWDTLAVIRHSYIGAATVFYLNCYDVRTCVYCVFKKLLYYWSRSVYYLACRNKLGNFLAQNFYFWHFSILFYGSFQKPPVWKFSLPVGFAVKRNMTQPSGQTIVFVYLLSPPIFVISPPLRTASIMG